tara:strand:- start:79 stop:267 length:189 start_codon:yes stop_codon:yes gene_type:complete
VVNSDTPECVEMGRMDLRIVELLYANVSLSESKSNEVISLALAPTRDVKGSFNRKLTTIGMS